MVRGERGGFRGSPFKRYTLSARTRIAAVFYIYIYICIPWFRGRLNSNREFRKKPLGLIEVTFSTKTLFYALQDAATTTLGLSISSESIALKVSFVVAFEGKKKKQVTQSRYLYREK